MSGGDTGFGSARAAASAAAGPVTLSRRNYVLALMSGSIGFTARGFVHAELVVGALVLGLTDSTFLMALVSIVGKAGMFAPQLWIGGMLEHLPRKRPWYVAIGAVRAAALVALIGAICLLARQVTPGGLVLFFTVFLLASVCGGTWFLLSLDMLGSMIPARRIGSFYGLRQSLGQVMVILAGLLVIQPILACEDLAHPLRYVAVIAIGTVLSLVAMGLFASCREGIGPRPRRRTTLRRSLRRGWLRIWGDTQYRRFFWVRVAFRVSFLNLVFFIKFGRDQLADAAGTDVLTLGGLMLGTMNLSRVASGLALGRLADRHGYRLCLIVGGACFALAPLLALAAQTVPGGFALHLPLVHVVVNLPLSIYLAALLALGTAFQGSIIGSHQFLLTSAPPRRRMSYIGFMNTATSPLTLLALAGAWLVEGVGVNTLFMVLVASGAAFLVCALRMPPRPTPPADQ